MTYTLPPAIRMILEIMSEDGFSCYLVGGSVRDILLNREPEDYDFVTNRKPEDIIAAAEKAGWKVWQHGVVFGIVNVLLEGNSYEIATMRTETYGHDPHRPDAVAFMDDIEQDLSRRDFTINAMAMDIDGHIIDPFGGEKDLEEGIIRCVGDPRERFLEDPLRIMRAARFISKTGFNPDPDIATASQELAVQKRFSRLSVERVRDELEKILLSPQPSHGLWFLLETGILEQSCSSKTGGKKKIVPILPELAATHGVAQNPRFHLFDVWEHTLKVVEIIAPRPVLRWAALLHDVAKGKEGIRCLNKRGEIADYGHAGAGARLTRKILERLRLPSEKTDRVVWLVRNHMIVPGIDDRQMSRWVKKRAREFPNRQAFSEAAQQLFLLADADNRGRGKKVDKSYIQAVTENFNRVMSRTTLYADELNINGDFIAQKLGQGPQVGKVLKDLLVDVQTGRLYNDRKTLEAAVSKKARRLARRKGGN